MATPGWYPDPSGQPSSFRYWDGQSWSQQTSDTAYSPPPGGSAPPEPPTQVPPRPAAPPTPPQAPQTPQAPPTAPGFASSYGGYGQGGTGWATPPPAGPQGYGGPGFPGAAPSQSKDRGKGKLIGVVPAAVVAVVLIAVAGFFGVRALTGDDENNTAGDDPSQTSDPSGDPTEDETDDPTEDPTEETDDPIVPTGRQCVGGLPTAGGTPVSADGLSGGGLSLPPVQGFDPYAVEGAYAFADGVVTVAQQIEKKWIAAYALGGLTKDNGFEDPEQAAEVVLACMTQSSDFYSGFSGRTDLESTELSVDGEDAWSLTAEVRVDDPDVTVEGDVARVVVVDTGDPESCAGFVSVVPLGDDALIDQQDAQVEALTVD